MREFEFKKSKVALAVAATLVTVTATAAITAVVTSNLFVDYAAWKTYIYPTAVTAFSTDYNGFLIIDAKEDVVPPGIDVYQDGYTSGEIQFNGCIMAKKEPPVDPAVVFKPCGLGPDSGKRFKLRAAKINQPMDIVFEAKTVGQDPVLYPTQLYNIFGKLTNETGTPASGFKIQIGTGIGAAFVESTATDGHALKPIHDYIGKYPGGLFGGSPAEGLPFFTVESAYFYPVEDVATTDGSLTSAGMPPQYTNLFGSWLTFASVPKAWLFDIDGRAWTDDKVVAYQEAGVWFTFRKAWYTTSIAVLLEGFADGVNLTPLLPVTPLPGTGDDVGTGELVELNPLLNPFVDMQALTLWLNEQRLLVGLGKDVDATKLVPAVLKWMYHVKEAVPAATIEKYEANPSTIRYSASFTGIEPTVEEAAAWPVVATFKPDCGDDGLYQLAPDYAATFPAITTSDPVCGPSILAADMSTVVKDNSGALTDYFGIPGFTNSVIEDLSNVNLFASVKQEVTTPLAEFTLRITVTDAGGIIPPPDGGAVPPPGVDPTPPTVPPTVPPPVVSSGGGGGGGCTIGNDGRFDPTLPAMLFAGLGFLGWRRYKAGK